MRILVAFVVLSVASVLGNDLAEFVKSNNEFSANVYKELAKENDGNFVVCPMSTEIALSMVHAGAKKQTAEQLAHGMSLPNSVSKVKSMMEVLIPELKSDPNVYTLKTLNKLYVSDDLKISSDYKTTVTDVFKSEVENVDFKKGSEAVDKINGWVSKSSDNHIKELIQNSDIDDNTKAVLLNSIYFQATWAKQFNDKETKKTKFYASKVGDVEVDMMDTTGNFEHRRCGYFNAQFLKMPYIGKDLTMVVILPNEKDGLAHIEANIQDIFGAQKFSNKKVHVNFPKFKMDATIRFIPILRKLGIVDLFVPGADLSGITSNSLPLYITNVIQKNYVEVNEKGTIAASATAAIVGLGSSFNPEPPVEFIADHPFIYYIESPAGILFIGRYSGH
ncbi:hypothetical protein FQR65_LT07303 [Abscondita terminalis]|nr:hypothetical protein FQR65_LT07303 [Abscondita terminalis]